MLSPKLMVMVSLYWKMNFLPSKIKKLICFIDDVLEINDQSRCILSGPPCIMKKVSLERYNIILYNGTLTLKMSKMALQFEINLFISNSLFNLLGLFHG